MDSVVGGLPLSHLANEIRRNLLNTIQRFMYIYQFLFTSSRTFRHSNLIYILNYSFWRHDISYSLVGIPENHERQTQFFTLIATRIGQRTTYTIITISTLLTCPLPIISGAQGANCSFHPGNLYQLIGIFAMTNMNNKSTCYKE